MQYMIPYKKTSASVWPVKFTDCLWGLFDDHDNIKAMAAEHTDGAWRATMNSSVGGEGMNFLATVADDPESALLGVVEENIRYTQSILVELQNIHANIEYIFDEPVEDVPVDIVA